MFESPCDQPHRFHLACIAKWGRSGLEQAVDLREKTKLLKKQLPTCPCCRGQIVACHNASDVINFFLISKTNALVRIGTVLAPDGRAPSLRLSTDTYTRAFE